MNRLLLSSKISPPKILPTYIERSALNQVLQANKCKRCLILRAPVGYGKTTVLNTWLQRKDEVIAWVSLNEADNDFARFWLYMVTSVARATNRKPNPQQLALIQAKDTASFEFFLHAFVEELVSKQQPVHIVLDDYHVIHEQNIHLSLSKLVDYLPEQVHLYITTRTVLPLPIAKWRVKQWVHEIDYEPFKFTLQEAQHFFSQTSASHFNKVEIQKILTKTEGWVAGLLLISFAQSVHACYDANVIQPFITDFLWQEILTEQPQDIQQFLLQTALLEELTPTVCNQLTGNEHSFFILQQLVERGLFTVKLQLEQTTFQYHPLLVEALRNELTKRYHQEEINALVKKTAQLLYKTKDFIAAIELALKYEHYELAVQWMHEHVVTMYASGQMTTYMRWLQQVRSTSYVLHEELLIAGIMNATSTVDIPLAQELIEELDQRQQMTGWMDEPMNAGLANIYIRTKAYFLVALGNRLPEVFELLESQLVRKTTTTRWDHVTLSYNHFEPQLTRLSLASKGKLISTDQVQKVIQLFRYTELNKLDVATYLYGAGAEIYYEQDELTLCEQELTKTLQSGHEKNDPGLYIPMYILRAKIYMTKHQPLLAEALLQEAMKPELEKHWENTLKIMQARCLIETGEWARAAFLLDTTKSYLPYWKMTQARLLMARGEDELALQLLVQLKVEAQREGQVGTLLKVAVLKSICYKKVNNIEAAATTLHEILPLALQYGYVRSFLDEPAIERVFQYYTASPFYMEQWDAQQCTSIMKLQARLVGTNCEPQHIRLTKREKQLLQLLIEGATNVEIAHALSLSAGTVRVYLSTLYSKIAVTSRVQAVLFGQRNKELLK